MASEISLHLLVKNGESVVGRLLDCVGPHIDEVVAVLDSCEDGTASVLIQKAAEHGLRRCELVEVSPASHPELYLLDVPETYQVGRPLAGEVMPGLYSGAPMLSDFAAARNLGWTRCLGDWRLFLDADDVVDAPGCLQPLCAALDDRQIQAASSRYYHGTRAAGFRERLARNLPQIRWEGVVHERLVGWDPGRAAHVADDLAVRDLLDNRGEGTRDPGRNLKLLYHRARSLDWQVTPREMVYLAAEARRAMPELSMRLAETCAEKSGWAAERAWACSIRGQVAEQEEAHDQAADWYRRSIAEHPSPEVYLRLARACFYQGQWEGVVSAHERARALAGSPQPIVEGDVDEGPVKIYAAAALFKMGRRDESLVLCREARALYPQSPLVALLQAELETGAVRG